MDMVIVETSVFKNVILRKKLKISLKSDKKSDNLDIKNYAVIEGREVELVIKSVVSKISFKI